MKKNIQKKIKKHYIESLTYFPKDEIVGIFLQRSQNYGLDYKDSDVDTKLIITPSFKDICLNKKPISTTYIRTNDEHIDWKDIRLYIETFRKQNLNFLEILFTDFYILNPLYEEQWLRLVEQREAIARMNPFRAVKSMKGITMEHRYPTKIDIINKYGYDGKQVSHLLRVDDFLERYISGETYLNCLKPTESKKRIMDYKLLNCISLSEAREEAKKVLEHTIMIADEFCNKYEDKENSEMRELLEDVSYNIMKIAVIKELKN